MIYENVELHNFAEVQEAEGGGMRMQRVPESVRIRLNESAQWQMLRPASGEIRFVSETGSPRVTLSSFWEVTDVVVFRGVFQLAGRFTVGKQPQTIEVPAPPDQFARLDPDRRRAMPFSPDVVRLMMFGGPAIFHGIEGEGVRPPRAGEVPALRYLTYGTSITHGHCATGPHLSYAAQTARRLGADLINLGSAGSAQCEHELADYIAARDDWDIASLALSVNMLGFSLDEFYERVSYMVHTVCGANTARPVACITLYPFFDDLGDEAQRANAEAFRRKLRDAVEACPHPNAHLIEGPEILTGVSGLAPDLIHPADNGMIEMGANLALRLGPLADPLV